MPDISIIIVNYNVKYYLHACLLSVKAAIANVKAEVIVIDNQSSDGSAEYISNLFPDVNFVSNQTNDGFAKANNQAIKMAKGRYVLLLNPDTIIGEQTLTNCLNFMDSHTDSGAIGVHMVDGTGHFLPESKRALPTPIVSFYKVFGLTSLFPSSKRFNQYHLGHLDKDSTHSVDILSGAFMMLRKETIDKIGLLDEEYFMYGEDIDLSYRVILGGYKNYYFSDARIIHFKGESTKKGSLNYVVIFYKAMEIFAQKYFTNNKISAYRLAINFAIYLRASLSLIKRIINFITAPLKNKKKHSTQNEYFNPLLIGNTDDFIRLNLSNKISIKSYDEIESSQQLLQLIKNQHNKQIIFSLKDIKFKHLITLVEQLSGIEIEVLMLLPETDKLIGSIPK